MTLKTAMAGEVKPVSIKVGEYQEPFPAEFERPTSPLPVLPPVNVVDKVYRMTPGGYIPPPAASRARPGPSTAKAIPLPPAMSETAKLAQPVAPEAAPSNDTEPKYQTGALEQEAYQLLLQANPIIAGMVQGSNPGLRFKSWDAAARGNDTYWVRIKFQSEGNPDVEYIWQVKLEAKQVRPLNFNARTLS